MKVYIIQLLMAVAGTLGFCLQYHLKYRFMLSACTGGLIGWLVYLIGSEVLHASVFLSVLGAGIAVALYAELAARIHKAPSTLFFLTATIPLIPGSALYYCMQSFLKGDTTQGFTYAGTTCIWALAIATGMGIGWALCDLIRKVRASSIHRS